jgi:hypothetical protein
VVDWVLWLVWLLHLTIINARRAETADKCFWFVLLVGHRALGW